jgi:hypothetical protein
MVEPHRYSEEVNVTTRRGEFRGRDTAMTLDLLVSGIAMALGIFAAASPQRVAAIWGWQRLQNLAPEHRASFISWYRIFGMLLFIGGVLFAVDEVFCRP